MPKKQNKVSKLSDADENYFKAKSLKERKLAVDGKPDSRDVEDLQKLFELYDRSSGGKLRRFCNQLKIERDFSNRSLVDRVDMDESFTFAIPQELQMFMERYYPTLWTNQVHARWFIRHFPMFRK